MFKKKYIVKSKFPNSYFEFEGNIHALAQLKKKKCKIGYLDLGCFELTNEPSKDFYLYLIQFFFSFG